MYFSLLITNENLLVDSTIEMLKRLPYAPDPPKLSARLEIKRVKSSSMNVNNIPEIVKMLDRVNANCRPARSALTKITTGINI